MSFDVVKTGSMTSHDQIQQSDGNHFPVSLSLIRCS